MEMRYREQDGVLRFRAIHIHQGRVYTGAGQLGQTVQWTSDVPLGDRQPEEILHDLRAAAAADGYHPLPEHTLMIQHDGQVGTASLLGVALSQRGFGSVEHEEPGSRGRPTVFASVIRPELAAACCVAVLREVGRLGGAILVSAPPDDDGVHVAHWPEDHSADDFTV